MVLRITAALVVPIVLGGALAGRSEERTPLTDPRPYVEGNDEPPAVSPQRGSPLSGVSSPRPPRVPNTLPGTKRRSPAKPQTLSVPPDGSPAPLQTADAAVLVPLTDPESTGTPTTAAVPAPTDGETQVVDATPVLSVATVGPSEINVGRSGWYTITVRNLGKTLAISLSIVHNGYAGELEVVV